MKPVEPIYVVELLPTLSRELITVLKSLQASEWEKPTICSPWSVKDVAAHLLGGNLGRLWNRDRTSDAADKHTQEYNELVKLINRDNDLWVDAAKRISPKILIVFLDLTDRYLYSHFKSLDQNAKAGITVGWASNNLPPNWFDIAREYTEKWLHQQHIREAIGKPLLTEKEWLFPVLDTFMRGLPHTYRNINAQNGTSISVWINGNSGGEWSLKKESYEWKLFVGSNPQASCNVYIDQDLAWRLFTKGIDKETAKNNVRIDGNVKLGEKVLEMVSIMA